MSRKGDRARRAPEAGPSVLRWIAWIVGAGAWLFAAASLASFDSADWPSRVVAVHNAETANACGIAGAVVAYSAYDVLGAGAWVMLAGAAILLGVLAAGRRVSHPLVRALGLLLTAVAVSSLHGLFLPDTGPLAGARPGLLATALLGELVPRFSVVGTFLAVVAALGVGIVVAFDRVALAALRVLGTGAARSRRAGATVVHGFAVGSGAITRLLRGRGADEAVQADGDEEEDEDFEGEHEDESEDEDEYEDEDEEDAEATDADEEDVEAGGDAEPVRAPLTRDELRVKIARLPLRMAGRNQAVARDEDIPRTASFENYQFPTLDLLRDPESNFSEKMEQAVRDQAEHLEATLHTFGIDADVVGIESGPAVTLYSVQLAPGTKVSKVTAVASDIARSLRAHNIRVVPNTAGKTTIGIEVPNINREKVRLKELMSGGHARDMVLPMFLGKDASGEPLVADLTRMPHMLIAGTTGSGKSVCMNSILMSWLYTKRPDELKLVLVDPKMVEMSQFADIPHLMCPVVTESTRAAAIMEWAVERMEERYELLNEARVQNVAAYNRLTAEELYELFEARTDEEKARVPKHLPYMVFVVDELADLILTVKEVEHSIVRIAQKARAVGIHLILATQRPQANVVTGLIKSNMPCRVSFKVASGMDSRIVLDMKGAELLLGQGDMMFLTPHTSEIRRAQGTLVEDTEIRKVVKFLRTVAGPTFERSLMSIRPERAVGDEIDIDERDPLFDEAVKVMIESGRGSVSLLQRRLAIGYGRASRLVDQMCLAGILGDHKGSVAREVMITLEEWEEMKRMEEEAGGAEEGVAEPPVIETDAVRRVAG
jgi:S-DNA-T family DNA segregation ATPase FtsK/SpoIIIE